MLNGIKNSTTLRNLVQKHSSLLLVRDLLGAFLPLYPTTGYARSCE
ncbi:MAG: hypothetical protein HQM08_11710 [Candidatus Riflebacteria bacterium]|nr:hypothetical protein [Candidatus Riflebacteria bacterium]